MSELAVFKNFREVNLTRNRYLRPGEWAITDANLEHGDLRPFKAPCKVCDVSPTAMTLYPQPECCCLTMEQCADPVVGFCKDQHLFLEDGCLHTASIEELCVGDACAAGTPLGPTPTLEPNCNPEDCDGVAVSYVMTLVTENAGIQIEGSPGHPAGPVPSNGHIPNVTVSWPVPDVGDHCVVAINLYRVESEFEDGSTNMPIEGAEWVLVGTFDPTSGTFTDVVPSSETTLPLTTSHPKRFPAPKNLCSLTRTADGIAVADDCNVYISLPGEPMFTWDGIVQIDHTIRLIRAIGNTIFVLTDKYPVRIDYKHTDGMMSIERTVYHRHLPLRSRGGVSVYGEDLYFPSEHSMMVWSTSGYGADIKDAFRGVFTQEQYHRLHPESIVGVAYEYGYFFTSKKVPYSFMVGGIGTERPTLMPITYVDADTMTLSCEGKLVYRTGTCLFEWDYRRDICDESDLFDPERSISKCFPFTAKLQYDSTGKNRFKVARVEWDYRTGTHVDFSIHEAHHGNDSLLGEYEVINCRGFGICGYTSNPHHYVTVSSCGIVHEVRLATAFADLVGRSNQDIVGS